MFFHNGVFASLQQVMDFYAFRDVAAAEGLSEADRNTTTFRRRYRANVDVVDPPFDRDLGDPPAISPQDEADIIAFLKTLTDGYSPERER